MPVRSLGICNVMGGSAPTLWGMVTVAYQNETSGERTAHVKTRQIRAALGADRPKREAGRVTFATLSAFANFSFSDFTNRDKAACRW